jgi:hypothetical protein
MKFAWLIPLMLLSIPLVSANTITVGVQPSEFTIDFYKYKSYIVQIAFFNEQGDTDAYYVLTPDYCLSTILKQYPKEVFVPRGTKRVGNPIMVSLTLERDNTGNKTCYLQVSANPIGNATLSIKPSVSVRFKIYQGVSEASYPSSSGGTGFIIPIYNPTTTTTKIQTPTTTQPSLQQTTTTTQQTQAQQKESRTNFVLVIAGIVVVVILVSIGVFIYLKYKII